MLKLQAVKDIVKFLKEVGLELKKVTWPKRDEVIKLTLIVFIISAVIGAYLGLLDFTFTKLLEFIIAG